MRIVGIPLTTESITDQFRRYVCAPEPRLLLTSVLFDPAAPHLSNDYVCARAGFDFLRDAGYQFIRSPDQTSSSSSRVVLMMPLWYDERGERRQPSEVADRVRGLVQMLEGRGLDPAYATPGSPRFYDAVSSRLIAQGASVIDTASAAELATVEMAALSDRPMHVVLDAGAARLMAGCVNIISCVGDIYASMTMRAGLMDDLSRAARAWIVTLSASPRVVAVAPAALRDLLLRRSGLLNASTVAIELEAA